MSQSSSGSVPRGIEPLPAAREVAPGIWKITLPIPFPLRTVNVYALIDSDGWVLVDTGIGTPDARAAFAEGLQKAGLDLAHLRTIVLTHHHPDHVGLSGELQEQSRASILMHPIDEKSLHIIWAGAMPHRFDKVSHFFHQHGLPPTHLWYTRTDPNIMHQLIRVPPHEAFTLIEDGQYLELAGETYQVLWVPGHADGQVVLFRAHDGVFLAADHVLPRITPNVGLYSEYDRPNPLDDYLNSLRKVENLPASLVLPGHGEPFEGLRARVHEILHHHDERLELALSLLKAQPRHAADLTHLMFPNRRLDNDEMLRMAVAEILAHLEYLRLQGKLRQHYTDEGSILYEVI